MATQSIALTAGARAIEAAEIHQAACRHRRQGLCCSTCSDLAERAERAVRAAEVVHAPAELLVVSNGVVSWSRAA